MKSLVDKKQVLLLFLVFSVLFYYPDPAAASSSPEIQTFVCKVDQPFGGSQSPDEARVAAIAKAKSEVIEKAGLYMESLFVVKNSVLEKDEITALAGGILKTNIISQKNYATEKGFGIILKAQITIDSSVMGKRIKKLLDDKTLLNKYKEIQAREKKLLKKIEILQHQNKKSYAEADSDQLQKNDKYRKEFHQAIRALPAVDWNRKAIGLWRSGRYSDPAKALEYLNESISLDPEDPNSYNNRGVAYYDLGQADQAIKDYTLSLKIDGDNADAYNNRGIAYYNLRKYKLAIKDYNQVIRLRPEQVSAFLNRGSAFKKLWLYQRAIDDYSHALNLDPDIAKNKNQAESLRIDLNELDLLCEKARKACSLGLCKALNYLANKGFCVQGD